jgi:hypothetical protein
VQTGVNVRNGSFSASLGSGIGLPKTVLDRKECWLAVSVRGPGEAGFTALSPRQLLPTDRPASVTALSCPHSHFTDSWWGTDSDRGLIVANYGTGDGVRVQSNSTNNSYAAVWAVNGASTGYGTAVYASSRTGLGVYATSTNGDGIEAVTNTTGGKSAVYAHSDAGYGVWAVSGSAVGVHGYSSTGRGVEGYSNTDLGGYFIMDGKNWTPERPGLRYNTGHA